MARTNDRDRNPKRAPKETRPRGKKKVCLFCKEHAEWVDYKDISLLRRFMSERGKIRSRRVSGNCTQHQRDVQVAIKTAREPARPRPTPGAQDVVDLEETPRAEDALGYEADADLGPELAETES
jgi:ribosomal protein S18